MDWVRFSGQIAFSVKDMRIDILTRFVSPARVVAVHVVQPVAVTEGLVPHVPLNIVPRGQRFSKFHRIVAWVPHAAMESSVAICVVNAASKDGPEGFRGATEGGPHCQRGISLPLSGQSSCWDVLAIQMG
jgi:hypothetical protein